ncbi:MAG TPA: PPOX class F420-dependent oxidoreductase [Acidimicrobiales bacterium]|jgi:PPOX class probable F420-dependent enzyme|nr:PPOX class F420-dependent oxidoreductase [Acidimicrobiales bacterium]
MLDEIAKELLGGKNYAAFTTLLPNGQVSTQMMWVDADDTHVLINTEVGRQKYRNVSHDPRVAVMVFDPANPYRYAEIRGRVVGTITGTEAREHIDHVSHKYTGGPYANPIGTERVILQIEPERVRSQG